MARITTPADKGAVPFPTQTENPNGLHQRYNVTKPDGSPVAGRCVVLKLDGDDLTWVEHCRNALEVLADSIIEDPKAVHLHTMAEQLHDQLNI